MAVAGTLRVLESEARVYRRTWRGSVISTFLNPVLFLLAMGVGLGELVDERAGSTGLDIPYLTFLAPALMAATAMQAGTGDASYPVMAGIKWRKTYAATLATPVEVSELVLGHLGWITIRLTFVTAVYAVVMALFDATSLADGLAAVPPAVLTGLAFAGPVTAYTATLKDELGLVSLFRFGIIPLFLFSGTFFPIDQLPDLIQPIAYLTPLWHGVELCRWAALGIEYTVNPAVSVAYLALWAGVGAVLGIRFLGRRLIT